MKRFKLWNIVLGWVTFAIAACTYLMTIEPTASFWDCGEFISTAYKLDVGHPPGAPFFMLAGHFFSLFAGSPDRVAMMVNAMSALFSAFTILFLFWTITALAKKLVLPNKTGKLGEEYVEPEMSLSQGIGILAAGMVGALAYTFSDTFWFSAVEGEVYAFSSLFTAVVFWCIMKWDEVADTEGSDRWLILIAYLMGLSIGVHLLNLLTIPAIVTVYYFRKYNPTFKGFCLAMLVSVILLAVVLYGMIPGFVLVAGWFEILFVNHFGMPFNSGLFVYIILTVATLVWAIYETYTDRNKLREIISTLCVITIVGIPFFGSGTAGRIILGILIVGALGALLMWLNRQDKLSSRMLNTGVLMITVILIGYSSYATIVIRSSALPSMDQNSPDNVFSLKAYLNREQYGDRPLFYGSTFNSPVNLRIEGNMCVPEEKFGEKQYAPKPKTSPDEKDEYIMTGRKTTYVMNPKFDMLFPRMYSGSDSHKQAYESWGKLNSRKKFGETISYDYCGQKKSAVKPTFLENMKFFISYQCNFMYWRYFMWNFAGRQNDLQGYGEIDKGNWITGISFIDKLLVGDQTNLPDELKNNKGHNVYYMLPLLLGILGIVFQLAKDRKGLQNFTITFLLFFLTGLAIVVYLNQTPYQPRERDYAYAGSFYAFCIWIGIGVLGIAEWINSKISSQEAKACVAACVAVLCLGIPALMAEQNWDDHDRSGRYVCRDFGGNYLTSCRKDAIIFSNGDNDTFPLWYNQEVEGYRTDVRVCNLSYVQTDWYISQMTRPYYESPACPISWEPKDYMAGKNEVVYVENNAGLSATVKEAFDFVHSDNPRTKRSGDDYLPTKNIYIPVSANEVLNSPAFKDADGTCRYTAPDLADRVNVRVGNRMTKSEMAQLEMISTNHWQRPIYYCVTVGNSYYQGLEPYFELTGLAYQVTPVRSADGQPRINVEEMYDNMMHKFRYGNVAMKGIYLEENTLRMCRTHRMMLAQLADELTRQGDKERALKVLDYAEEVLPGYNVTYDYTSATMAANYCRLEEFEKADAILDKVADNCAQYLRWTADLKPEQRRSCQSTINHKLAVLNYVINTAERYDQNLIADKYQPMLMTYQKLAR